MRSNAKWSALLQRSATLLLFLLLGAQPLPAQQSGQIEVSSEVDRSTIRIGDLINYRVTVRHAPDVTVIWPSLGSNLGAFEIREYEVEPERRVDGWLVATTRYTISTFDTGSFIIPPLVLEYAVGEDSALAQLQTEPLQIYVESMKPSEADGIRGLKPQAEVPRDWRLVALYSGAGLLLLLLVALAIWYFRYRRRGLSPFARPAPPPRPAHEVALEALRRLQQAQLPEKGEIKSYFIQLSDVLRRYLAGRFGFAAMELTTVELSQHFAGTDALSEAQQSQLLDVLELADMVKFAKFPAPAQACHDAFATVQGFVEATKPRPVMSEDGESASRDGRSESETPVPAESREATAT